MKRRIFLPLLILLTVLQAGTIIDFSSLNTLFIGDDHPKFYSYSIENAELLLNYGTPFGFNHYFQGGIPTFYLRSCFLELIPFALLFGYPVGYKIMLIFFLALIPLSFFFLVREWTNKEDLSFVAAFFASFYMTGYDLKGGMTPCVVGYSLTFLTLFFFSRYESREKPYLFPLLLSAAVLAYTHLVFFAMTCLVCTVLLTNRYLRSRPSGKSIRKIAWFAIILAIVLSDLLFQLFYYRDYLRLDYACQHASAYRNQWEQFLYNMRELLFSLKSWDNALLISGLALGISLRFVVDEDKKRFIIHSLYLSGVFLLNSILHDLTPIDIFFWRIGNFTPYIFMFNLALIFWLPLGRYWRFLFLPVATAALFYLYPLSNTLLPTVKGVDDVDHLLVSILDKKDFVLFEHQAHVLCSPSEETAYTHQHWEKYLQRDLGVKMLAHMGEDANPYNALRHMYVSNGRYLGKKIDQENEAALIDLISKWGVNKACVWSQTAKDFFQGSPSFVFLGKSKYYTCFSATYPAVPEVISNGSAVGDVLDVTPFSFRVHLHQVTGKEKLIVNKNYFPSWTAYDERGRYVPLRAEGQKISFETNRDADVFFLFRRNHSLYFMALAGLMFVGGMDLLRLLFNYRRRRQKKDNSVNDTR